MKKKAQVKMAENIGVIIIFIVLLMMGLTFYTFFRTSTLEKDYEMTVVKNSIDIAQRVVFLPELQCGEDIVKREDCIDLFKAAAIEKMKLFNTYSNSIYFPILGFSDIRLTSVFPEDTMNFGNGDKSDIVIYSNPLKNKCSNGNDPPCTGDARLVTKFKVKKFLPVPVTIYNPLSDQYSLGVLEVTVYG
jgi:hypothetical protein